MYKTIVKPAMAYRFWMLECLTLWGHVTTLTTITWQQKFIVDGGARTPGGCPHDTFPNRARSITPGSRPVARVHTGATGTLVPVSRDHVATWNERARSIAIDRALSSMSCGRSTGRLRPVSNSAAVSTSFHKDANSNEERDTAASDLHNRLNEKRRAMDRYGGVYRLHSLQQTCVAHHQQANG